MPTARQLTYRFHRKQLTRKVMRGPLITGAVAVAASSPFFITNILGNLIRYGLPIPRSKHEQKDIADLFTYLRHRGYITISFSGKQMHVSLTPEGKRRARQFQINDLEIAKPRRWDKRWRIIMFDIPERSRIKREALRGKLKELGFLQLQKSVWIHPFPCHDELDMLQRFFGFSQHDYTFLEAVHLGNQTAPFKKKFKLA